MTAGTPLGGLRGSDVRASLYSGQDAVHGSPSRFGKMTTPELSTFIIIPRAAGRGKSLVASMRNQVDGARKETLRPSGMFLEKDSVLGRTLRCPAEETSEAGLPDNPFVKPAHLGAAAAYPAPHIERMQGMLQPGSDHRYLPRGRLI